MSESTRVLAGSGNKNGILLLTSTLLFVLSFVVTTILHETGHYAVYALAGLNPSLHHNYVIWSSGSPPNSIRIIGVLAGPALSLIQGLVMGTVASRSTRVDSVKLFTIWLALHGYVNALGYVMLTPIPGAGDTAVAAALLGMPFWLRLIVGIAGLAVLVFAVIRTGRLFSVFIPRDSDLKVRGIAVYQVMFIPVILGSALNTLLAFPVPIILSAIYPATSSFVIMCSFPIILKHSANLDRKEPEGSGSPHRLQPAIIAAVILAVVVNRLLVPGVG